MKDKKVLWIILGIVVLIFIDQAIKFQVYEHLYNSSVNIISGVLNLTYVENTGAAFGWAFNSVFIIISANVVIIGMLISFIIFKKEETDKITLSGLSLIIAGGTRQFIRQDFQRFCNRLHRHQSSIQISNI